MFAGGKATRRAISTRWGDGLPHVRARLPLWRDRAFQRPRFDDYRPLSRSRPDLPAWLDAALAKAVAARREQRQGDALEFAYELETGLRLAALRLAPGRR